MTLRKRLAHLERQRPAVPDTSAVPPEVVQRLLDAMLGNEPCDDINALLEELCEGWSIDDPK